MRPFAHYLVLLLIITLGVSAGNLISNAATAAYAGYQIKNVRLEAQAKRAEREQRHSKALEIAMDKAQRDKEYQLHQQEIEESKSIGQRAASSKARKMMQSCRDWSNADKKLSTEVTKTEARKACDTYHRYVTTGRL